jgi:hypothetical protein
MEKKQISKGEKKKRGNKKNIEKSETKMGVLAKILGAHGANVAATLAAVYLCGRLVSW